MPEFNLWHPIVGVNTKIQRLAPISSDFIFNSSILRSRLANSTTYLSSSIRKGKELGETYMAKRSYSQQDREQIKEQLLQTGLELFAKQGYKNTRLSQIFETVGISKTFFYTFFVSKEELVLHILNYQQEILFQAAKEIMEQAETTWKEKLLHFFSMCIHHKEYGIFIMTQEEEVMVFRNLAPENYQLFQQGQMAFYENLLHIWEIPTEKINPKVLCNLVLSVVITYNSAADSMPFFYSDLEILEETARLQSNYIVTHLERIKNQNKLK